MAGRLRSYSELRRIKTYEERFEYLKLGGKPGDPTFGHDRWMNQAFYSSTEWRHLRHKIIARDLGRDMAMDGYDIYGSVYIHHMNPMAPEDLVDFNKDIVNPEYLISVALQTHNAIHYGDASKLPTPFKERTPGDTKLW